MYKIFYILNDRIETIRCRDKTTLFIVYQALKEENVKILKIQTITGDDFKIT